MDPKVARARSGEAGALDALLADVAPTVLRFARRMCRSDADADDVLQDTLLLAATNLDGFEGRSSLSSWLFALARSACARKRRGLANRPADDGTALDERPDPTPSPEDRAEAAELASALDRALRSLPAEHREVLLLRDVEGLTAPEAAEALGVGVGALKSRLHRARAALRTALLPVLSAEVARPDPGCPDVVQALSRKLEGELTGEDCAQMERHVESCTACAAACDALQSALASCRLSRDAPVSPAVRDRIRRALDAVRAELAG